MDRHEDPPLRLGAAEVAGPGGPGPQDVDELNRLADEERSRPRRRHGFAARALFVALDLFYGRASTLEKFRVLELVARVPYQAWEQVAFVAVTHVHSDTSFARDVHRRAIAARAQQDNELLHLLIIEEMLDAQGFRRRWFRGVVLPQAIAFGYYQLSWLLFVIRPRWSYALNADFEDHATATYLRFVDDHPELDEQPWSSQFEDDYGSWATVGDVFRRIALDERFHRDQSEASIAESRFGNRR